MKSYPGVPDLQVARMLCRDYPLLYRTLAAARSSLQYYSGAGGEVHRKKRLQAGAELRPLRDSAPRVQVPPGIRQIKWEPVEIQAERSLVLADIHSPFQWEGALDPAIEYGIARQADACVLLGDFFDFTELSMFERDKREDNLKSCLHTGFKILKILAGAFPQVIWKLGNHDERWLMYLLRHGVELCGLNITSMAWMLDHASAFSAEPDQKLGIKVIEDRVPLSWGKLHGFHGHEVLKGVPITVNAARTAFLRTHDNVLIGHCHQTSNQSETTLSGRLISCWSVGCLTDLRPRYMPVNPRTGHGLAVVERFARGQFKVDNLRIIDGKVW
jgi:predicted phosphodiesterase